MTYTEEDMQKAYSDGYRKGRLDEQAEHSFSEWIQSEKKTPKNNQKVIARTKNSDISFAIYRDDTWWVFQSGFFIKGEEVSAWMPLPGEI